MDSGWGQRISPGSQNRQKISGLGLPGTLGTGFPAQWMIKLQGSTRPTSLTLVILADAWSPFLMLNFKLIES